MINIINDFKTGERPILAIQFRSGESVKVSSIRGATKIYVNPGIPELIEFKKSRNGDHPAQSSRVSAVSNDLEDILSKVKIATLAEIKNTNTEQRPLILLSIRPPLTPLLGGSPCGTGVMMMMMKEAVDISAATMVERREKDGDIDSIPHEFSKFIDKKMAEKVRVSREYNLQSRRSHCYPVCKFSDDKTMISKWNDSYKNIKDKEKEKVGVMNSEDGADENGGDTFQKSSGSDLVIKQIIFVLVLIYV